MRILGIVAGVALALFGSGRVRAQKLPSPPKPLPSLIALSTQLVDLGVLRTWLAQHDNAPVDALAGVNWLSGDAILAHDNHADGAFLEAYRLNLRTGERFRLPQLTHAVAGQGYMKPGDWKLSPDKRWVLWRDGWLEKSYGFLATQVDGARSVRWSAPKVAQDAHLDHYFWIPGTHKWINLYSADQKTLWSAQFYDLDAPKAFQSIPLASLRIGTDFLGQTNDGTLWAADDDDSDNHSSKATVVSFRLELRAAHMHRYTLALPQSELIHQIKLAPDGRTLALLGASEDGKKITLWRCGTDGSALRRIAGLAFGKAGGWIGLVGWRPDGKSLLFAVETYGEGGQGSYELRELPFR